MKSFKLQFYNVFCQGLLVNFRRMPFQSTQKSIEDVDNGHLKECRAFDVDLHCNTFKINIRFRTVFSQAYGGACRRDRTRKTQLPNAETIDFFFLVREKGGFVRTLRTPLGYVPDKSSIFGRLSWKSKLTADLKSRSVGKSRLPSIRG